MPRSLSLSGDWSLSWHDDFPQYLTALDCPARLKIEARVPEPVHVTLMRHGLLDDPRVGLNSLKARWVEEQFWVYRRTFATPDAVEGGQWLVFDHLEYEATVWLNGEQIGRHASAHVPTRFEVAGRLRPAGAENVLVVRVDAGLFGVADKPGAEYMASPSVLLTKRHWQRKGQWQCGWDWQQRLMNVGILGDVRLEWSAQPIVTQCQVYAVPADDLSEAVVTARFFVENPFPEARDAHLYLRVVRRPVEGERADQPAPDASINDGGLWMIGDEFAPVEAVTVPPGRSVQTVTQRIPHPRLWWPAGHGEPTRYTALCAFHAGDRSRDSQVFDLSFGVRKVEVDQSPHPETGRHFTLRINNRPIFCKGGNWVPADMLHSTVSRAQYAELVDLALGANFNLLRIWGGGVWAGHDLLDECDAKGVLVWHDLLFACAKYPGDHPEWAQQAHQEVTWGMREFAHHPSLVVWCGNNEIEEGDWNWGYDRAYRTHPHYALFHHDFPKLARTEAPYAFYWISSPYSPDYENPTDPTVGDQHPWGVSLRQDGPTDWWEYRSYADRFPNEGGVLGASSPATLRQFLPADQRYLHSPAWEHHDNPFAMQPMTPGQPGRAYQTVALWTGRDPAQMDWEEYAFASALLQAEGLTEYIANYRRRMFSSAAAIFWMYNDSWPVTHGWTLVDYYRRKKLAYHPVRRAFAPVAVVCAVEEDTLVVTGVNDSPQDWEGAFCWWVFAVSGTNAAPGRQSVRLPANTAVELVRLEGASALRTDCGYAALLIDAAGRTVAQHRLFLTRFGGLGLDPNPAIARTLEGGTLTLRAETFVWGVCLDVEGEKPLPDNCFDLLPGVPYALPWDEASLGEPKIVRTGNSLGRSAR